MAERIVTKRLAAILAADIAGYTRLMEEDTDGTVRAWHAARAAVIDPSLARHAGRIVKHTGDGFLAEFQTVQDAVSCALALQDGLRGSPLKFRVGINLGDIIDDGEDIHGEGVNIAARLESIAEAGGICVSGSVHEQVRNRVEAVFEDWGERAVKHVSVPLRVYAVRPLDRQPAAQSGTPAPLQLPDKPSIAVLPFDNMSGEREQEYFADGMAEDIITALSRVRWLFVIARNSSFTYKGQPVDLKKVGRELGVRYVLEGSVRKAGSRLRITAQLIDASTGAHLWAERFDGELADVFDLQDQVTGRVVGTIAPRLEQAEIERRKHKPTESLDAYDYFLRGMAAFHRFAKTANEEALGLFMRAVERDPHYSPALGMAARCHAQRKGFGWLTDPEREKAEGLRLAHAAADLGRDDPIALAAAGFTLVMFGEIADGNAFIERALVLDPNLAWAWNINSFAKAMLGEADSAIEYAAHAMRLSPQDPQTFAMQAVVALGHFVACRYAESYSSAQAALRDRTNFPLAACVAAASAAQAGRSAEAAAAMARVREISPTLRLSDLAGWLPFQRPEDFSRWADGLRKAGLPA